MVQHQSFHSAGIRAFDLGHDVVQVVQRLDTRAECSWVIANRCGSHKSHTGLIKLRRIERNRVGNDDHLRIAGAANVEAQ